ncbi:MAG: T9SS type A sorting domain-containing protein, partial [Bacteroidota bacterium]
WAINAAVPNPSLPVNSIFGPYHDMNPNGGGTVHYMTTGTTPFRSFVVSFNQVTMFGCTNLTTTHQIVLYESTNIIEVNVLNKPSCANWNGGVSIIGLQNVDGTVGYTAPGTNFPMQWTAASQSWRFSPVGPCAGAGNADIISGRIYHDLNADCTFDSLSDSPIANRQVMLNSGSYFTWTDNEGRYAFAVSPGTYTVSQLPSPLFTPLCPASGTHSVTVNGNDSTGLDFADTAAVHCPDLLVDIGAINLTRCLTDWIGVYYCNNGTITDTAATVEVTLNDSLQILSATMPYTVTSPNVYAFDVGALNPGACGNISILASVGCDTAGTLYCLEAEISGSGTDCDLEDNLDLNCIALSASFDPNDKTVAAQNIQQSGWVVTDTIEATDQLEYRIRFQNTGNDTAFAVVIRDTLAAELDPESVHGGAASHPYQLGRIGNAIFFQFDNILLPDSLTDPVGSQGFVTFRVSQNPGNTPGTVIENTASIYFDFNPPIVTNTTENVVTEPVSTMVSSHFDVHVYPNPGQASFVVAVENAVGWQLEVFDVAGRKMLSRSMESQRVQVDAADWASGLYFYRVRTPSGIVAGKWLKE